MVFITDNGNVSFPAILAQADNELHGGMACPYDNTVITWIHK
jgi:hypothetical protein